MSMSIDLNPIIGALEVGLLVTTFLFGIATVQAWIYFEQFQEDRRLLKATVMFVWFLELAHIICNSHAVYTMAVTDYGQVLTLTVIPQSIFVTFVLTGVLVVIVQSFYAFRILTLTGQLYIPIFCWAGSFTVFIISIVTAVIDFKSVNAFQDILRTKKIAYAGLILAMTVDTVITVSLCWYFNKRRTSAMKGTKKALQYLMGWTMETGFLTSLTAVAVVATFQTMSTNYIWLGLWMVNSGVIANSFYALLNARLILRNAVSVNPTAITVSVIKESDSPGSTKYVTDKLQFKSMNDATLGQDTTMSQSQYHK